MSPARTLPPPRRTRRSAFSLVEMVIALGVFTVTMTLVLSSLTNLTSYSTQESAQTDMVIRGREAARLITNDLANSSWLYDYNSTTHQMISTPMPNALGYTPPSPYANNPLLPWVWIDGTNYNDMVGTTSNGVTSWANQVSAISATANPAWEKDVLEYVKVRTSDRIAYSPLDERYEAILNQPGVTVTTLDQFQTGVPTPFMIVNDNYPAAATNNDIFVSHVWEAGRNASSKSATPLSHVPLTFDQNQNPAYLRHYHLEVINVGVNSVNPSIQTGTLVRTYWNGNGSSLPASGNDTTGSASASALPSWNPDDQQVLLYNVQSFVVRTIYQPLANATLLQPNQISVSIVIQDPTANPAVFVSRTISFITAMRSLAQ